MSPGRDSIRITTDRHTLPFLKARMLEVLERRHDETLHLSPPDAPEVYEFRRDTKDQIVYLEVERLDFDRWALTLKGGTPGEIRSLALDVWQESLLDITDRFRLDVSRDITQRKRAEFKALLDRMTQDLLQED